MKKNDKDTNEKKIERSEGRKLIWLPILSAILVLPGILIFAGVILFSYNYSKGGFFQTAANYAASNAKNKIVTWVSNKQASVQQAKQVSATASASGIRQEKTARIGKHIYYPADSFFGEGRTPEQKKAIKKYLKSIDKKLTDDVYVTYYMYYPNKDRIDVSALPYENGAVVLGYPYTASSENDDGFVEKYKSQKRPTLDKKDVKNLIDPKTAIPDVKDLASKNTDRMLMDRGNEIYGTYLLRYNPQLDFLYYEFTLNLFSYVNVDAKTGEITGYYFYNGVVY